MKERNVCMNEYIQPFTINKYILIEINSIQKKYITL